MFCEDDFGLAARDEVLVVSDAGAVVEVGLALWVAVVACDVSPEGGCSYAKSYEEGGGFACLLGDFLLVFF